MKYFTNYLWRLGRFLYLYARGDSSNNQSKNGEFINLNKIISGLGPGNFIFFDVGANKGVWIDEVLGQNFPGQNIDLYAFEPSLVSSRYLKGKYGGSIKLFREALSDVTGLVNLWIYGDTSGINSLYKFHESNQSFAERVNVSTVDDFCLRNKINEITFIKSDTEGNCFNVIKGASSSLSDQKIHFWQFEYNYRWIYAGYSLLDVFKFMKNKNYFIGKLHKNKIYIYRDWHFELDRFIEANYILIRKDLLPVLGESAEFHSFNRFNVTEKQILN